MKSQSLLRALLVLCLLLCGQANALTYTYSGPAFSSPPGGYFNASITVDSNADGYYSFGSGLTSLTLGVGGWSTPSSPSSLSLTFIDAITTPTVFDTLMDSYVSFLGGVIDQWSFNLTSVDGFDSTQVISRHENDIGAGGIDYQGYLIDEASDNQYEAFAQDSYTSGPQGTWQDASSVPEPATLSLLGLALIGIGVSRRRKQK